MVMPNEVRVGQVWHCDFDKEFEDALVIKTYTDAATKHEMVDFAGSSNRIHTEMCTWVIKNWRFTGLWVLQAWGNAIVRFGSTWRMNNINNVVSYDGNTSADYIRWGSIRVWSLNDFIKNAVLVNDDEETPPSQPSGTGPAINDFTCPRCRNNRQTKKSHKCWWCGCTW